MSDCPTQDAKVEGDQRHVAKVKGDLEQSVHLRLKQKVVNAVGKNIYGDRCAAAKGRPLPVVVLRVQTKVDDDDACHAHDYGENEWKAQQETVDVVVFVIP